MYISDTRKINATYKSIIAYSSATIACFLFQLIYGQFSHGVSSNYMTFAFVIPLLGGVLSVVGTRAIGTRHRNMFSQLVGGAVIWLTLGSIFTGALEIYGTTNHLTIVFVIAGIAQLIAALIYALS